MTTRPRAAITAALSVSLLIAQPTGVAAAEVDKTGLDILCTKKGDRYIPPENGISACMLADGTILICDSKTDTCTKSRMEGNDKPMLEGELSFRLLGLLKRLNERVGHLESKSPGGTSTQK